LLNFINEQFAMVYGQTYNRKTFLLAELYNTIHSKQIIKDEPLRL